MHHTVPARDFSNSILSSLSRKGIRLYGSTWLPGPTGSYLDGERGYLVDDNGCGRVWKFLEVKAAAK